MKIILFVVSCFFTIPTMAQLTTVNPGVYKWADHPVKIGNDRESQKILEGESGALEYHWNDGELQRRIASNKYQYVVVQQGPSSQADGRAMLLDYGQRIKALCNKHNSQLAFFMVWPARVNSENFEGVITNYSDAARTTGSLLCPVGKIWREHFELTQDYSYYGPDGFHPSLKGSEVAAQVIYESLSKN